MVKILSQAGSSLADVYDVAGSIAGIEQLETRELPIVHEMGQTIFAERYSTYVRLANSGNIAQNTDFNIIASDLPRTPARLLGVAVYSDAGARVLRAAIHTHDPETARDFPVWVYDGANFLATLMDDGGGPAVLDVLLGNVQATMVPNMVGGTDQPEVVDRMAFRGRTTGFGAGTVFIRALYYIASSSTTGSISVSSRGLPIPSW